ncbi:MAG: sterol desaturase family protein, partial [Halofilum sp. (in: g-proteobacteria)]
RWERLLRHVIVTPRFHTSHHTVSRRTGDANFATIFIVWDRLFGTYREPDFEEMQELGLAEGRYDYLSFTTWLTEPFGQRNQNQAYRER